MLSRKSIKVERTEVFVKKEHFSHSSKSKLKLAQVSTSSPTTSQMTLPSASASSVAVKSEKESKIRQSSTSSSSGTNLPGKSSQQSKSRKSSGNNLGGCLSYTRVEFQLQTTEVQKPGTAATPAAGPSRERLQPAKTAPTATAPNKQPTPSTSTSKPARHRRSSEVPLEIIRKVQARRHTVTGTVQIAPQPLPQRIKERRDSGPRRKRKLGDSEPFGYEARKNHRHRHQQRRQDEMYCYIHNIPKEAFDSD